MALNVGREQNQAAVIARKQKVTGSFQLVDMMATCRDVYGFLPFDANLAIAKTLILGFCNIYLDNMEIESIGMNGSR